jgi:hypothetical protein
MKTSETIRFSPRNSIAEKIAFVLCFPKRFLPIHNAFPRNIAPAFLINLPGRRKDFGNR